MKYAEFDKTHTEWLDRFITAHDRDPNTYEEFVQFQMDTMVDEGKI